MTEVKEKTPEEKLLETAKTDEGTPGAAKPDEGIDESPEQKLIKDLRERADEADRRAVKAEGERDMERAQKDSARKEASTAAEKQVKTQEEVVKSNLNAAKSKFDSAQKEWDDAYDAGDRAKLRDAQIRLNDAQMELRGAEFNDTKFKSWKETRASASASDGLLDFKTGSGDVLRVPQSAVDWARRHSKFSTDPTYTYAVYGGDTKAKAAGIEVYSQGYYDFLDKHLEALGLEDKPARSAANEDDLPRRDDPPKKNEKQTTAAPPGGSTGSNSSGSRKRSFTMTAEMRRAAQFTWPDEYKKDPQATEEKYAKKQIEIAEKKARGELK